MIPKNGQKPEPPPLLYALERDGLEYKVAVYIKNGPTGIKPEWQTVDETRFYEIGREFTVFNNHAEFGRCGGYVLQFYNLEAQLRAGNSVDADLQATFDRLDEQRDEAETLADAACGKGKA